MSHTIFSGTKLTARGTLAEVTAKVRALEAAGTPYVVFDDETGRTVDVDWRDVVKPQAGPGRPKLGVTSREISLLPRHWEWLATQPGGASVTLRKLVEEARKQGRGTDRVRQSQEAAYRFMLTIAGDLAGYEEALRALFARDAAGFRAKIAAWPADVRRHALELAAPSFSTD